MRRQKGSIIIFLIILVVTSILIVAGMFLFKNSGFNFFKQVDTQTPTKREGEAVDLTKKPAEKFLPDYIMHCNNTSLYHWTGSECVRD